MTQHHNLPARTALGFPHLAPDEFCDSTLVFLVDDHGSHLEILIGPRTELCPTMKRSVGVLLQGVTNHT